MRFDNRWKDTGISLRRLVRPGMSHLCRVDVPATTWNQHLQMNKLENSCLVRIQSKNRDKKRQINVHKCGHTLAHADTHIIDDDGVSIISDSLFVSFQVKITSFPQSETFTPECSTHTEKPVNHITHTHKGCWLKCLLAGWCCMKCSRSPPHLFTSLTLATLLETRSI